ncbi:MAG: hypothetical protein HY903_06085 [Deltaproteobacteria bacterium]|nr:hypothetical protein [Deltaproteobacteria bacterium]
MTAALPVAARLQRLSRTSHVVGLAVLALAGVGAYVANQQFLRSYLVAFLFWLGLGLGSLALLMLHHLVGGRWGKATAPILAAAARTLPLLALLFVPIAVGLRQLYVWATPIVPETHHAPVHHEVYLSPAGFLTRAALYFVVWIALAALVTRLGAAVAATGDLRRARWLARVSAAGLALYVLSMSFAAFDWGMSLDPQWYSTIYGLLFIVGQGLSGLALVIVALYLLAGEAAFELADRFHDLGNLLMAFVMLWAYISFSQLIIIWSGNLPEEIPWYLHRFNHGWEVVGLILVVLHFAVPFSVLLARRIKRRGRRLAAVALFVLLMRQVDLYWIIAPVFQADAVRLHWLDPALMCGLGGLWLAVFSRALARTWSVPPPRGGNAGRHRPR